MAIRVPAASNAAAMMMPVLPSSRATTRPVAVSHSDTARSSANGAGAMRMVRPVGSGIASSAAASIVDSTAPVRQSRTSTRATSGSKRPWERITRTSDSPSGVNLSP